MAKNLDNLTVISNGDMTKVFNELELGKTVLLSIEKGPLAAQSIAEGYSEFFKAKMELAAEGAYEGLCGCGKPADAKVYLWRE
ncbi:hypothetical protein SSYRP_v1c04020 [Spiroplasma syrphidicola EA-1]|uniref:Uncharacterized protein n=1 Tax=Spiroplasma syrphidicola EA-1 TaxID=1276229 RepID=R4UIJ6_9MOLU|nr:hypothetical protein [Spiroplasma syrphidicola]AGM25995.1 hypothetical protein SSYRP_v1c04020 [Spiroplasma syrphidicola EA-1]